MRIAARQAHWLQAAFKDYLEIVGEDIGCAPFHPIIQKTGLCTRPAHLALNQFSYDYF